MNHLNKIHRFAGLGRPPGCKLIRVSGDLAGGILRHLEIRGDFFASPEEDFDEVEKDLCGTPPGELAAHFDALVSERGIQVSGINGAGLASIVQDALREVPNGS